jgi:hypothetical protein
MYLSMFNSLKVLYSPYVNKALFDNYLYFQASRV